jgi:hypothetical protein
MFFKTIYQIPPEPTVDTAPSDQDEAIKDEDPANAGPVDEELDEEHEEREEHEETF